MFTLETHLISDRPGHSVSFFPQEYKLFKKIFMEMASLCVLNLMVLHKRYFHNGAVLK